MHYHKYRWLYAFTLFTIFMLVGILQDIYPTFNQRELLTKSENTLRKKLIIEKQSVLINRSATLSLPSDKSQTFTINDLMTIAQMSGLMIKTINLVYGEGEYGRDELHIHWVGVGDFVRLAAFVFAIENRDFPASIHDFSYKLTHEHDMRFSMNILLTKDKFFSSFMASDRTSLLGLNNPFCSPLHLLSNLEKNNVQSVPLDQIKMIGYLHKNARTQALLLLPNGMVTLIECGSIIGRERGIVRYILRNKIVINLQQEKKDYVLTMF